METQTIGTVTLSDYTQDPFKLHEDPAYWDRAANRVRESAPKFAALTPLERAKLLRACMPHLKRVSEDWVRASCLAKGVDFESPTSGEEQLGGPACVMRNLRLLAESLERFAAGHQPHDGLPVRGLGNGHSAIRVFPTSKLDAALFGGFSCEVIVKESATDGVQSGPVAAPSAGHTCLVLGAGNVNSIPAMDVLYKMFVEGFTCVLKMNPVNQYVGPIIGMALAPLVEAGYLAICYGGAAAGKFLCEHSGIDEVHITGSDVTHDMIVWGPPGEERERRKAADDPILAKPVTSELGNVSPVIIVPGDYTKKELRFMARNVAAMVANNASCNCNAAKMLVTCKDWAQRREFLTLVYGILMETPCRVAYYPGAHDRYRRLASQRGEDEVSFVGRGPEGSQPWALIAGLDPKSDDPLFSTEPFCAILSETALRAMTVDEFVRDAVTFCNEKLWGTLNVSIMIDPRTEKSDYGSAALQLAINTLNYGTVAVNHWPALGYGFVSPPWGAAPGHTLKEVVSGIGWVHNTYMLYDVVKSVIRGPLVVKPKPAWFTDNAKAHEIGRKLVAFEAAPCWSKLPGIVAAALRG